MEMQYREFGNTGKQVSIVGFGGVRFDVKNRSFDENVELVVKAVNVGINYFDTAHLYCNGQSERIIGEGLLRAASFKKHEVYVSSKSAVNNDPNADAVLRRVEKSLVALQVDKLNFFHIWGLLDMKQFSQVMKPNGPIYGAIRAKEKGLIDHICVSVHLDGDDIESILKEDIFDGITIGFNALNWRYRMKGLKLAADKGLGVAIMNPLGGGVIPRSEKYFSDLDSGDGIAAGALRFVASHKEVSTVLVGVEKTRDIDQACDAIGGKDVINYNEDIRKKIYALSDVADNQICSGCKYCSECPKELEPFKLMSAYNEYIFTDGDKQYFFDRMKEWYGFSAYLSYNCISCGKCERHCTQHLPIINRIKDINDWVKDNHSDMLEICNRVFPNDKSKPVALYAASVAAAQLIDSYKANVGSIDFPLYLFDSNKELHGLTFAETGLMIHRPEDIVDMNIKHIVVAQRKYFNDIENFLRTLVPIEVEIICI
ncbi:aldo/keto reductase [Anaerospora hongkongensis]|uniref:aldo/keto reductase n=1 Tax=Anaerospora hongkongensis TaxID=244830 RepID=UPI00289A7860|nr:aldo/keto reductase [Anaerospora hongkongensis]